MFLEFININHELVNSHKPLYRYFVVLRNPWSDYVRIYTKNDNGGHSFEIDNTSEKDEKTRDIKVKVSENGKQIETTKKKQAQTHFDSHGEFEMELRDLINVSSMLYREE